MRIHEEIRVTLTAILKRYPSGEVPVGSICSGGGTDWLLFQALNEFSNDQFGTDAAPQARLSM